MDKYLIIIKTHNFKYYLFWQFLTSLSYFVLIRFNLFTLLFEIKFLYFSNFVNNLFHNLQDIEARKG